MEADAVALAAILGAVGLLLAGMGYLIRFRKSLRLISGYRPDQLRDPDGLARFFGGWTIALGFGHLALAALALRYPIPDAAWVAYVLVVIAWLVVVGGYGNARYADTK